MSAPTLTGENRSKRQGIDSKADNWKKEDKEKEVFFN
jgi:hypothetical protein